MVMNLNACRGKIIKVTSYANAGVENSTLDLKQCTIWKTTLETGSIFWFTFPNQKILIPTLPLFLSLFTWSYDSYMINLTL